MPVHHFKCTPYIWHITRFIIVFMLILFGYIAPIASPEFSTDFLEWMVHSVAHAPTCACPCRRHTQAHVGALHPRAHFIHSCLSLQVPDSCAITAGVDRRIGNTCEPMEGPGMHVAYETECLDGKLLPVTEGTEGRGYDKEGCFSVFSTAALQIWGIIVGVYVVVALVCACLALRLAKRSPSCLRRGLLLPRKWHPRSRPRARSRHLLVARTRTRRPVRRHSRNGPPQMTAHSTPPKGTRPWHVIQHVPSYSVFSNSSLSIAPRKLRRDRSLVRPRQPRCTPRCRCSAQRVAAHPCRLVGLCARLV